MEDLYLVLPRNKSCYWQGGGLEPQLQNLNYKFYKLQDERPKLLGHAAFSNPILIEGSRLLRPSLNLKTETYSITFLTHASFQLRFGSLVTYRYLIFARFANTPSERDAMALERKSLKMQSVMFEMMKRD